MKRVLIWLVLRQEYDDSYAWKSAGIVVKRGKQLNTLPSFLNIIRFI